MKERPIIFSAPMVRAILAGQKTQTRRVVKGSIGERDDVPTLNGQPLVDCPAVLAQCPYGQPGDRLWVRETHIRGKAVGGYAPGVDPDANPDGPTIDVIYRADDGPNERTAGPWTPAIHMPRWASRILLEIAAVRVERLQDISEADAMAEGVAETTPHLRGAGPCMEWRYGFEDLWQSINGPGSWDVNPWVWVIEFRRIDPPQEGA